MIEHEQPASAWTCRSTRDAQTDFGQPVHRSRVKDALGIVRAVMFAPEDLSLVKGIRRHGDDSWIICSCS